MNLTSQSKSLDPKYRVSLRYEFNYLRGVNRNIYVRLGDRTEKEKYWNLGGTVAAIPW